MYCLNSSFYVHYSNVLFDQLNLCLLFKCFAIHGAVCVVCAGAAMAEDGMQLAADVNDSEEEDNDLEEMVEEEDYEDDEDALNGDEEDDFEGAVVEEDQVNLVVSHNM